ncbi:IS30 family transposase [Algoriphagus antarcticus]|uniref:IS30 family transposase n=2 Tax=Algoriphagus antarcticus TaxID=238540 RepID=A0A3E0CZW3_9BACT|nr:IS30 family transposase [Algoriphagus antarcticus]REG74741.1 IS30 family transposase [Algoriphagus antarcticus]
MSQLTLAERYEISAFKKQGLSNSKIAELLDRAKSTIGRELTRNADGRNNNYRPDLADKKAHLRHQQKNKYKALTTQIQEDITYWLKQGYSPEQINGSAIRHDRPCVSIERIYQFIWQDKKDGGRLYIYLRTKGKKYHKRGNKKAGRGLIPNRTCISQRPEVVDRKQRIGDMEMDLIIGKGHKGALLTINDRATGTLWMGHVKGKEAADIERKAIALLEDAIPFLRTITTDNGKEFANHEKIAEQLGIDFYFARPYHSWERGANENLNGLVRQYFPKGTNFDSIEDQAIKRAENILNNRPRKRYGFKSPNEVFADAINNEGIVAFMT